MIATFIRLENTFEAAMLNNGSPQDIYQDFRGVHLVSDNTYTYSQRTYAYDGIEIEDVVIEFYDMCGKLLLTSDVSTFKVEQNFNDLATGLPQIIWSLNTTGLDFGNQLVYFVITSGANGYVYSSPFVVTADQSKFTTQFWYKSSIDSLMLSIGINMYRRNKKSTQNSAVYDPVSSEYSITASSRVVKFERFLTGVIWDEILEEFKNIFDNRFVYSKPWFDNGLPLKTSLYQAIESIDPEADENFISSEILLTRNYGVTFNPNEVPIVPPEPPVDPAEIILVSVTSLNSNQVSYNFTFDNFTPNYLTYQYSTDNINWIDSTGNVTSPHTVTVPNNDTVNYYYRITHTQATSNVKRIPRKGILLFDTIALIGTASGLTKYRLDYLTEEYAADAPLRFEYSPDGIEFSTAIYPSGNENPKDVNVPDEVTLEPYFRIVDDKFGLVSNIEQYTE